MTLELNTINTLNFFLMVGVVQGFIVSGLLFLKAPRRSANRLLAFWILLLALSNLQIVINTSLLYKVLGQRFTLLAPLSLNLFFGPLIWLFCQKATTDSSLRRSKYLWHLVPGLLEFLYYLLIYIQPLAFRQQFYGAVHWRYIEPALEVVATASFLFYLTQSLGILREYGLRLRASYSDPNMETYGWLQKLLRFLCLFSLIWLVLTVVDVFFMGYQLPYLYFYPYYFLIAYLSYFIGFSNYYRSPAIVPALPKPVKTTKAMLSDQQMETFKEQLTHLMDAQRLYLNSSLRAQDVAKALGTNVQTLSYVLNQGLNVSFHDFINQLRVDHVKSCLNTTDLGHLSLLGIAKESGFNSESSFYRIFKKFTGLTPKGYLKSREKLD